MVTPSRWYRFIRCSPTPRRKRTSLSKAMAMAAPPSRCSIFIINQTAGNVMYRRKNVSFGFRRLQKSPEKVDKARGDWYNNVAVPQWDNASPDPLAQLAEHLTFNQRVWSSSLQWITIPPALVLTRAGGFSFFRRNERKGPWKGQEGYPGHPVGSLPHPPSDLRAPMLQKCHGQILWTQPVSPGTS